MLCLLCLRRLLARIKGDVNMEEKMNYVLKQLQGWDNDELKLLRDLILMKLKSLKEMES